jgi:hypothetical protein
MVNREGRIDRNLPTKPSAEISKRSGVSGAKDNFLLRQERNHKILAIAAHRDLSTVSHA